MNYKRLSKDAELLLLIMGSHDGEMSREDAEAEFARVLHMEPEERETYVLEIKRRTLEHAKQRGII